MLEVNIRFDFSGLSIQPNFILDKGGVLGLTGPSGIGKSTLLKSIAGLARPKSGTIKFADQVWDDCHRVFTKPQHRSVGLVFQDYALFPNMTVAKNLSYAQKVNPTEFEEIIDGLEIRDILDAYPNHLSGGQKQRVAIGRTLASNPRILLMDEPFSALDDALKDHVKELIKTHISQKGCLAILSSHDQQDLLYFGGHILKIEKAGN